MRTGPVRSRGRSFNKNLYMTLGRDLYNNLTKAEFADRDLLRTG